MPDSAREKKADPDQSAPRIDELAERNPGVDMEKFREAQAILQALKEAGVPRQEYSIASPYSRRPLGLQREGNRYPRN
jgi:hypothetical protein